MTTRVYISRDMMALALGAERVVRAFAGVPDVEIVRNGSRGLLWLEPMIEVDTPAGRIAYGPVRAEDVAGLLQAGMLQGGAHALRLGRPEDMPYLARQQRLTFSRCGIVDPLSLEDYRAHGGLRGLDRALEIGPAAIVEALRVSGLRGRGGAGFPTAIKWDTVRRAEADCKYVVCNADEGDSGTFADRLMLEGDPFCLIEGMIIAAVATRATQGYVYVRSEYPQAFDTFGRAIEVAYAAGLLGEAILGSPHRFDLQVRLGAGAYICGEETSMLESLEGRRGRSESVV